jgi:Ca2+-binding RTX toxin-like protein
MRTRTPVLAIVIAALLTPAAAHAATLDGNTPGELDYTAGAAIANNLTLSESGSNLVFTETAETITLNGAPECALSGANHTATCSGDAFDDVFVDLGDMGDTFVGAATHPVVTISGGSGADHISGGPEEDVINGGSGGDILSGGGGFDLVDYRTSLAGVTVALGVASTTAGAPGENDQLAADFEGVFGSDHDDTITGGSEADEIDPEGGADTVSSGGGDDTIIADDSVGLGVDDGADQIDAGPGNDTVEFGGSVGDTVHGGDGDDHLFSPLTVGPLGGTAIASSDTVFGDAGDDTIQPGLGNDIVSGGDGNDTFVDETSVPAGQHDDDTVHGDAGDDTLVAAAGNDTVDGGAGDDDVEGGPGSDVLTGGAGIDALAGGPGADTIHATDGERDSVSCGGGADTVDGDAIDFVAADCPTITGGAVPAGGAGSPGVQGLPGSQGLPGPAGASAPPVVFVLVAVDTKLTAARGHKASLRYVSTLAGAATLVVKKGSKTVATIRATTKAGVDTISWNGKSGSKKAAKGTYALTLTVVSVDGRTKTAKASVRVR